MTASPIAPPASALDLGEARLRVTALLVATMWFDVLYGTAVYYDELGVRLAG